MDLKIIDKDSLISGLAIPNVFQTSLKKRGKKAVNHRYEENLKELQVKCSRCGWHSVYKLEDGAWKDVNQTYRVCHGKQNAYFDSYCNSCYEKNGKGEGPIENKGQNDNNLEPIRSNEKPFLPWSEKSGGKQSSVFLLPEHEKYLKLYGVVHNKRKNQLINEIIAEFQSKNPLNL